MLNATVARVTERIVERSKPVRRPYLSRMAKARDEGSAAGASHLRQPGARLCRDAGRRQGDAGAGERRATSGSSPPTTTCFSAHQPFETYPELIRRAAREVGGTAQVAGGVVATQSESDIVAQLSATTALLLLGVFTVVNVACLVLRRDERESFFRSPGPTPVLAALLCLALIVIPWGERDPLQYKIAGALLGIGVVLWALTWLTNRGVRAKKTGFRDIEHMEDDVR